MFKPQGEQTEINLGKICSWKGKICRKKNTTGMKEDWISSVFQDTNVLAEDKNLTMEI